MLPIEHAPDLRGATAWHNVAGEVDLRHDLAGQVVVLLFFTPSCVHSREALLTLALLDARFTGRPLAVVGIATPRDPADARVDDVLAEYDVRFPVALDGDAAVWNAYGCGAWPTLVLVDATGRVRFHGLGEPDPSALTSAVRTLLAEIEYGGEAHALPAVARVVPPPVPVGSLAQPCGLALDAAHGVLWIADTLHHRLVAVDAESGAVREVIGGVPGANDGAMASATFCAPRGLAFDTTAQRLLVADTGNHLLRQVDAERSVSTLLGNGARSLDRGGGARGVGQGLASPFAVCASDGEWLLAVAAAHQIWGMDGTGLAVVRVGSGVLGRDDGAAATARLSQPRALAVRGREVAFCDFANHAVRLWNRATDTVATLIGVDAAAGDAAGDLATARLQQPSAVVWHGDDLIVADTGNGKLKRIERARQQVTTLAVAVPLERPVAMALDGDVLFVADSARRVIVVLDLRRGTARELSIDIPVPAPSAYCVQLRAQADCGLKIPLALPPGASVHPDTPVRVALSCLAGKPLVVELTYDAKVEGAYAVLRGVKTGIAGEGRVRAELRYYTRHGEGRVAHAQNVALTADITLLPEAPTMALWTSA